MVFFDWYVFKDFDLVSFELMWWVGGCMLLVFFVVVYVVGCFVSVMVG